MSFSILNGVLVLLYWAVTKNFFPELSGANYYFGLALCVIAAKVFASKKESPEGDSIVFRALLPLMGSAMIFAGVWTYFTSVDIPTTDSEIVLVRSFPEEIFAGACVTTGILILIMSILGLSRK